jgi:hypothetical protein
MSEACGSRCLRKCTTAVVDVRSLWKMFEGVCRGGNDGRALSVKMFRGICPRWKRCQSLVGQDA